jgi:isopentenyl-diphosphate delta-isomerase
VGDPRSLENSCDKNSEQEFETNENFEQRKRDHIRWALDSRSQTSVSTGLDRIEFVHEAIPDMDFSEVNIQASFLGNVAGSSSKKLVNLTKGDVLASPFFISSMTAGHQQGISLNQRLAKACARQGWPLAVGSQRRELSDPQAGEEWAKLRSVAGDHLILLGNLGIAQVIQSPISAIQALVDSLQAKALYVHMNPLQECLQKEGTPQFRGSWKALENLVQNLSVPVIVKEVGCGFSSKTLNRLFEVGIQAVDISGLGGTHWGRIEGLRAAESDMKAQAAVTFADWGIKTLESLLSAVETRQKWNQKSTGSESSEGSISLWASGGVRNGLDAAKLLALGAERVGFARPALQAAMQSEEILQKWMQTIEFELKVALFCTGCKSLNELKEVWRWQPTIPQT